MSRVALGAPGLGAPQRSRVSDAAPAAGATKRREKLCGRRRRRLRAGTRPAPRPDAQFGSCLGREGGSAASAVGQCSPGCPAPAVRGVARALLGTVVHCPPARRTETATGLQVPWGFKAAAGAGAGLVDWRPRERGRSGGSRQLGRGGRGGTSALARVGAVGSGAGSRGAALAAAHFLLHFLGCALCGAGVPAARRGRQWDRVADVPEGGAHLFSTEGSLRGPRRGGRVHRWS